MHPGAEKIGGGGDVDYPRAGAPELLGDRLSQRVITANNDFAVHDLAHLAETGSSWTVRPQDPLTFTCDMLQLHRSCSPSYDYRSPCQKRHGERDTGSQQLSCKRSRLFEPGLLARNRFDSSSSHTK